MLPQLLEWFASMVNPRFKSFREGKKLYETYVAEHLTGKMLGFESLTSEDHAFAAKNSNLNLAKNNYRDAIKLTLIEKRMADYAVGLYQLGMLEHLQGDFDSAFRQFDLALITVGNQIQVNREIQSIESGCYYHQGIIAWKQGDEVEAKRLLGESLNLDQKIQDMQGQALCRAALDKIGIG